MGSRRTGPYETIFPTGLTSGAWQNTDEFIAGGQAVMIDTTLGGGVGMLDLQVQRFIPATGDYEDILGAEWRFMVNDGGTGCLPLAGVTFIEGERYRLQFRAEVLDVAITIRAFSHDGDPNAGSAGAGPNATLLAPLYVPCTDGPSAPIGTYHYPSADGVEVGRYKNLNLFILVTGTAAATVTATVQTRVTAACPWQDVSLSGYDALVGDDRFASVLSNSAVAASRQWHFDLINAHAWRIQMVVAGGASGPLAGAGRMS